LSQHALDGTHQAYLASGQKLQLCALQNHSTHRRLASRGRFLPTIIARIGTDPAIVKHRRSVREFLRVRAPEPAALTTFSDCSKWGRLGGGLPSRCCREPTSRMWNARPMDFSISGL